MSNNPYVVINGQAFMLPSADLPAGVTEVKMTELQREQLEMSKQEHLGNLRASCYGLTMNRLQAAKQEEKFNDLPYVLAQADMLFKFINDSIVPEATELNNKVVSLRAVTDKPSE